MDTGYIHVYRPAKIQAEKHIDQFNMRIPGQAPLNWRQNKTYFPDMAGTGKVLFALSILFVSAFSLADELFAEIAPSPSYTPDEVVGIQMRALANNDTPFENAGIELTFRFASPGNKAVTGPLERFMTLFDGTAYSPMLNHADLHMGEAIVADGQAMVAVIIEDDKGRQAGYMFTLSRQTSAPYKNCWMTDTVIRVPLSDNDSPIF